MKNLRPFDGDIMAFYKNAISCKQLVVVQDKLAAMAQAMEDNFHNYDNHFLRDDLQSLVPDVTLSTASKLLSDLYSYRAAPIVQLKAVIAKLQPQAYRYTCQHCTLTGIESFDHFVPRDEFPEFSIHPVNLIPSCIKCNQHKGKFWRSTSQRTALNLYIDKLPEEQYLFVRILRDEFNELDFEFFLDNPFGIEASIFGRLEFHFKSRNLFNRMREKSIPVITELKNSIITRVGNSSIDIVKKEILITAEENKKSFGHNYWKSIVETALIDAPIFTEMLSVLD